MSKKTLILALLFFATASVALYSFYFRKPEFDIRKFTGNIVGIEGETIKAQGIFFGPAGTIPNDLLPQRNFTFRLKKDTRFEKLEIRLPTKGEVIAAGGSMQSKIEDLPQVKGPGSFQEIKNSFSLTEDGRPLVNITIEVDFQNSIYNFKNPIASFVYYQILK